MKYMTNLGRFEINKVFEKLDIDKSGHLEFEEFYLIFSVLIAIKVAVSI